VVPVAGERVGLVDLGPPGGRTGPAGLTLAVHLPLLGLTGRELVCNECRAKPTIGRPGLSIGTTRAAGRRAGEVCGVLPAAFPAWCTDRRAELVPSQRFRGLREAGYGTDALHREHQRSHGRAIGRASDRELGHGAIPAGEPRGDRTQHPRAGRRDHDSPAPRAPRFGVFVAVPPHRGRPSLRVAERR
jgi:hypothetical protein